MEWKGSLELLAFVDMASNQDIFELEMVKMEDMHFVIFSLVSVCSTDGPLGHLMPQLLGCLKTIENIIQIQWFVCMSAHAEP